MSKTTCVKGLQFTRLLKKSDNSLNMNVNCTKCNVCYYYGHSSTTCPVRLIRSTPSTSKKLTIPPGFHQCYKPAS